MNTFQNYVQQVCIPVGCCPYLVACTAPGTGGCLLLGRGCLPGGVCPDPTPPPVDRILDTRF